MGTLTANQTRLPEYCEHKLPTSCRLSSIPQCCACADERAHSAAYTTYVDGVGLVSRGTRWQRYCWFCKEFWQNRVDASGLRPGQTRVPEEPDQTIFVERWYEFHQGFRTVTKEDGSEERVAVLGEDFRDVSPGCLPRTLDEMRAGRVQSDLIERERQERQQEAGSEEHNAEEGPSLEETLDMMLEDAAAEEPAAGGDRPANASDPAVLPVAAVQLTSNIHAQAMVPVASRNREYQARRVASLRRELQRMRSGIERVISGLRELGENVPDYTAATSRLAALGQTLDTLAGTPPRVNDDRAIAGANAVVDAGAGAPQTDRTTADLQARLDGARRHVDEAQHNRDQACYELQLAERELRGTQARLRQVQSDQRTMENMVRVFGTREEVVAQGENYESPIGGMFARAYERFRVAEEVRREERNLQQALDDEVRTVGPDEDDLADRSVVVRPQDRAVWEDARLLDQDRQRIREATAEERRRPLTQPELDAIDMWDRGLRDPMSPRLSRTRRDVNGDRRRPGTASLARAPVNRAHPRRTASAQASAAEFSWVGGPPGQQLDDDPATNNDRGLDAVHVLSALAESTSLRAFSPRNPTAHGIRQLLQSVQNNDISYTELGELLPYVGEDNIIWGSGLPAERNRRRRARGEAVAFSPEAFDYANAGQEIMHDVEIMAESFQMSAQVRMRSELNTLDQLAMLYRLQRGERSEEDRAVLSRMLQDAETISSAREAHREHYEGTTAEQRDRIDQLDQQRREVARQGDYSRRVLNLRRRNTSDLALAAGRTAMLTGPAALLERMVNVDDETRAAYQRLQENGFTPEALATTRLPNPRYRPLSLDDFTASPSATESDHEEESLDEEGDHGRGLDAENTGRPEEPMTDEEMTVKLECRICYSHMATIATIPCGHLAMCQWCSEQHSPSAPHDKTRPRQPASCPVCRKGIRSKLRVIRA